MRTRVHLPANALVVAVAAACGGPPEPPPPAPASGPVAGSCPLPLVFTTAETRPVRVRIENRTTDTLDVFIDRCWRHTRLASVPPGKYRQPELPATLVEFPEGLRFHVFDMDERAKYGVFTVPVVRQPILTLVLGDQRRADEGDLASVGLPEGERGGEDVGSFAVGTDEAGGWASVFSEGGSAALTWSCTYVWKTVGLSVPFDLTGPEADVSLRRDGGAFERVGTWAVQEGLRDAVVPPEDLHDELRTWFGGTGTVDVLIEDGVARQAHAFEVDGLEEALAVPGCWGERR